MTREEAIAILEVSKHMATSGRMYNQAIDMAIEALHREEAEANGYCHRIKPKEYFSADAEPHKVIAEVKVDTDEIIKRIKEEYVFEDEVVRCKDCKQRRVEGDCTHYYYCDFLGSLCGDNEYCSFGERREL